MNETKPILKWVGGKRQLLHSIVPLIDSLRPRDSIYVEPFLGGGAILFSLRPSRAIVNDLNRELIELYETVRDHVDELIAALEIHRQNHCEEYFYRIRALDRSENFSSLSSIERAARTIYLNKTCFNGLYRVNASGFFNVPFGRYKQPSIVDAENLRAVSNYFRSAEVEFRCEDYRSLLERLDGDCFVYLDPPYAPLTQSSSFTNYTRGGFGLDDQLELRDECLRLRSKKIPFVESNSDCEAIRELYKDFSIETVRAKRAVNSVASKRGEINEVLIYYGGD